MRSETIGRLVGIVAVWGMLAGAAAAQEPAGKVTALHGSADAVSASGVARSLSTDAPVYQGETLRTSARSALSIEFNDHTTFDLGADAEMEINDYVYHNTPQDRITTRILKGVFRFLTGLAAKARPRSMRVDLASTASIGIRGTHVVGQVVGEEATVILAAKEDPNAPNAIDVSNQAGSVSIDQAGYGTVVANGHTPPTAPRRMALRTIQNLMRSLTTIGRMPVLPPRMPLR